MNEKVLIICCLGFSDKFDGPFPSTFGLGLGWLGGEGYEGRVTAGRPTVKLSCFVGGAHCKQIPFTLDTLIPELKWSVRNKQKKI